MSELGDSWRQVLSVARSVTHNVIGLQPEFRAGLERNIDVFAREVAAFRKECASVCGCMCAWEGGRGGGCNRARGGSPPGV